MAKKRNGNNRNGGSAHEDFPDHRLHPDTKKSIWGVSFLCVAVILTLAEFAKAGPAGNAIYNGLDTLFGWGYFILPATLVFAAIVFLVSGRKKIVGTTLVGAALLILSFLGLIEIFSPTKGGWLGLALGSLRVSFRQNRRGYHRWIHSYHFRPHHGKRAAKNEVAEKKRPEEEDARCDRERISKNQGADGDERRRKRTESRRKRRRMTPTVVEPKSRET